MRNKYIYIEKNTYYIKINNRAKDFSINTEIFKPSTPHKHPSYLKHIQRKIKPFFSWLTKKSYTLSSNQPSRAVIVSFVDTN